MVPMLIKLILIFLLSLSIYAKEILKEVYYIDSRTITLKQIIPSSDINDTLFTLQDTKHKKKIKSSDMIRILNSYGYSNYKSKHKYVNFIQKSPIDTQKINKFIEKYYNENYNQIDINNIIVEPRSYMETLPKNYTIEIRSKNYLSNHGTISIKTIKRKKIFFNYYIDANVDIYMSRKKIKKKTSLSAINTSKKSIILDKFKAKPIQLINKSSLQARHHISSDKIITIRDVETLSIVKKGSYLNVTLDSNYIAISFSAKALQDARIGDIINVMKLDGKKMKVKIIGKNQAEIR